MKKFYLFMLLCITAVTGAMAQTGQKYYLDIAQDNTRYYFEWDETEKCYVLEIPELWGDFKIYDDRYKEGNHNQNQYIFGASDVGQGAGVTPDSDKKLANPGQNMSIEGGGILYGVKLKFDPTSLSLNIVGGSHTPPTPTKPSISIEATRNEANSPETGEIDFKISTALVDNPESLTYDVYAIYTSAEAEGYLNKEMHITGTMTGTFEFGDLKIDTKTPVWLVVRTTLPDGTTQLISHAETYITTPPIPWLVGQIQGRVWDPEQAIEGKKFDNIRTPECYYWTVTLVDNGEFSFISKPGSWDTVNAHPRYAPSERRVQAPLTAWVPYTRFGGSTENAWTPEPFEPGVYTIEFSFHRQSVAVVRSNHPTGVEDIGTDTADSPVDVYSLQGILLRHDVAAAQATEGLPAGLYIVGNKKVLVH